MSHSVRERALPLISPQDKHLLLVRPRLAAWLACRSGAILVASLLWASAVMAAGQVSQPQLDAAALFDTLTAASRELDYHGVFTYEYAGMFKSVEVTHVARDGVEHERWFYLNGPVREVFHRGVTCRADVDSGFDRVAKPAVNYRQMSRYYELQLWGEDRIADHPVWVLHLLPRDGHRYGFVLSVDQRTGLLLQSLLLDGSRHVLERFQYLKLDYTIAAKTAAMLMKATRGATDNCAVEPMVARDTRWQASWLPPGFELISRATGAVDGVESLLYSDGLSVFSVFIDPRSSEQLPEVQAQRGATVAQLMRVEARQRSYLVSVVGEVPLDTAQRVAQFIRYGSE